MSFDERLARGLKQQLAAIADGLMELMRMIGRVTEPAPGRIFGVFDDLEPGDHVFIMGHRFHWLGIVHAVSADKLCLTLNEAHQINYDEENTPGAQLFVLGDEFRIPIESIGGAVQKLGNRPGDYRRVWEERLAAWLARKNAAPAAPAEPAPLRRRRGQASEG